MGFSTISFGILYSCIFVFNVNAAVSYLGDVAINCGSPSTSNAIDGREWIGEADQRLRPKGKSRSSTAAHKSLSADPIPYLTARISATEFVYNFQVSPGQKFLRLHFYPSSYSGFEKSQDFFTVRAGPFTLLSNFSPSLTADDLGSKYVVKEFLLNMEENKNLYIVFSASQSSKMRNYYALVNGVEIISMPTGLYYTPDGDLGACIVGQSGRFYYSIDNSTALELVHRLNIGGGSIISVEDFGMFRSWSEDANYLLQSRFQKVNPLIHGMKYANVHMSVAPLKIYQTSWKAKEDPGTDKLHNFTWKIPVHLGFGYLVRLHFSDFVLGMTGREGIEFSIFINHQIAETNANVLSWSNGDPIPVYRDYVVMMKGDKRLGKVDIFIVLQSQYQLVVGLLNGLEIFKLSDLDNNLATPNAVSPKQPSAPWSMKKIFFLTFGRGNATVTGLTILLILVNVIVYNLRQTYEENFPREEVRQASSNETSCRCFSLVEIKSATQDFSDAFIIGNGGFGKVYKGSISGGSQIVAIKRLKSNSKQGAGEFWTEIETLSKLRHVHLVSLIGYCNEYPEMILVYEYMSRGTLADNLYKNGRMGILTWEQRLRICIASAHGLNYLHTGSEHGIIHRDVKDTNILLDENFVAKISDFGLSKLEKISQSQSYVISKVKGTYGYLDPNYFMTRKLTRKADVYSFGVVLLVVLCGKPALYTRIPGEPQSLLSNFHECVSRGELNQIIDPNLQVKITSESLKEYVKSVKHCLHQEPKRRPTMAQVVVSLEHALELQQSTKFSMAAEAIATGQTSEPSLVNTSSSSLISQENVRASLDEVIADDVIHDTNLQVREGIKQKPFRGWPWEALWNRGKPMKKKNSVSPDRSKDLAYGTRFSLADIRAATNNFSDSCILSKDDYLTTYKGFMKHFPGPIAIYHFEADLYHEDVQDLCNEIGKLLRLRHFNLHSMVGYCCHEKGVFRVYKYTENGNLHQALYESNFPLEWHRRLKICIGIARGLEHLHDGNSQTTIHGDLRPENILLDELWNPKVLNYGLLKLNPLRLVRLNSTPVIMRIQYLPPDDVSFARDRTKKTDVYSFGMVLLEVLCGRRPLKFGGTIDLDEIILLNCVKKNMTTRSLDQIIDSSLKGQIVEACLAEFLKTALSCLLDQEEERPAMRDVVSKLQLAELLQQKSEMLETKQHDTGFDLMNICDDISHLAALPTT